MVLETCAVVCIGLIAGVIVNMLADALPRRHRLRTPRYPDGSRRPPLAWLGLSAFIFKRRSAAGEPAPGGRLGRRYPLAEIACALLTLLFYVDSGALLAAETLAKFAYAAVFVLIGVVDLEHRRIPFAVSLALGALALFEAALIGDSAPGLPASVLGGLVGFALAYASYVGGGVYARLRSRNSEQPLKTSGIGFGDVVLMGAVGLTVGLPAVLAALALTVFAAGAAAIAIIGARYARGRRYQAFDSMPLGPFIVGSAVISLLFL